MKLPGPLLSLTRLSVQSLHRSTATVHACLYLHKCSTLSCMSVSTVDSTCAALYLHSFLPSCLYDYTGSPVPSGLYTLVISDSCKAVSMAGDICLYLCVCSPVSCKAGLSLSVSAHVQPCIRCRSTNLSASLHILAPCLVIHTSYTLSQYVQLCILHS